MVELSSFFGNVGKNEDSINDYSWIDEKRKHGQVYDCRPSNQSLRISSAYNTYINIVDERQDIQTTLIAICPPSLNFKFENKFRSIDPFKMSNGEWTQVGVQVLSGRAGSLQRELSSIYYWSGGGPINLTLTVQLYAESYRDVQERIFKPLMILAGLAQPTTDASGFLIPPGPAPLNFTLKWKSAQLQEVTDAKTGKTSTESMKDAQGKPAMANREISAGKGVRTDIKIGDWFYLSDVLVEDVDIKIPMNLAKKFRNTVDNYRNAQMNDDIKKGTEESNKLNNAKIQNDKDITENNKAITTNQAKTEEVDDKINQVSSAKVDRDEKSRILSDRQEAYNEAHEDVLQKSEADRKAGKAIEDWQVENKNKLDEFKEKGEDLRDKGSDFRDKTQQLNTAKTQLNDAVNQVSQCQSEFNFASDQLNSYEKLVSDTTESINSKQYEIDNMQSLAEGTQKEVDRLSDQKNSLEQRIAELRARIEAGDRSEETLRAFQEASSSYAEAAAALVSVEKILSNRLSAVKKLTTELKDLKGNLQQAQGQVQYYQQEFTSATEKLNEAKNLKNSCQEAYDSANDAVSSAKGVYDKSRGSYLKTSSEGHDLIDEYNNKLLPTKNSTAANLVKSKQNEKEARTAVQNANDEFIKADDKYTDLVQEHGDLKSLDKQKSSLLKEKDRLMDQKDKLTETKKEIEDKIQQNKGFLSSVREKKQLDETAKPFSATISLKIKTKYVTTQEDFRKILSGEPIPRKTDMVLDLTDDSAASQISSAAIDSGFALVGKGNVVQKTTINQPTVQDKYANTKNIKTK